MTNETQLNYQPEKKATIPALNDLIPGFSSPKPFLKKMGNEKEVSQYESAEGRLIEARQNIIHPKFNLNRDNLTELVNTGHNLFSLLSRLPKTQHTSQEGNLATWWEHQFSQAKRLVTNPQNATENEISALTAILTLLTHRLESDSKNIRKSTIKDSRRSLIPNIIRSVQRPFENSPEGIRKATLLSDNPEVKKTKTGQALSNVFHQISRHLSTKREAKTTHEANLRELREMTEQSLSILGVSTE